MKTLFVLTLVIPILLAIDVNFKNRDFYKKAITRINIPSCNSEPCKLFKGTPLNITVTVKTFETDDKRHPIGNMQSSVRIHYYRARYIYDLAEPQIVCKINQKNCPISPNRNYTIERQLFLSKDSKEYPTIYDKPDPSLREIEFKIEVLSRNRGIPIESYAAVFQLEIRQPRQ